jgi:hypothetical protein
MKHLQTFEAKSFQSFSLDLEQLEQIYNNIKTILNDDNTPPKYVQINLYTTNQGGEIKGSVNTPSSYDVKLDVAEKGITKANR